MRFQLWEEEQQQPQEQQEGSMSHCTTSGKKKKLVENYYCFSRVLEGTLGSFWARFWRCSVLQCHCVSLSGRVRFQLREEEQQQQQEQQEGSMSHCTTSSGGRAAAATGAAGGFNVSLYNQRYKNWSKTIVFLGFQKGR